MPSRPHLSSIAASLFLSLGMSSLGLAQGEKPATGGPQSIDDIKKRVVGSEIMMNPYGKFIALDRVFSEGGAAQPDWNEVYGKVAKNFNPDDIKDEDVIAPLLLGSRIADGVLTVKMKNSGELGACAEDIERLAKRMGVSGGDLRWAKQAKGEATAGEWGKVYVSLGFLQMKVNQTLNKKASEDQKTLLLVGGWMQASRFATTALKKGLGKNMTPDPSYHLREPKLAEELERRVKNLPADMQKNPVVVAIMDALPKMRKIVDIDRDPKVGKIPPAQIDELEALATGVLNSAMKGL
jgi:hypothetical protein